MYCMAQKFSNYSHTKFDKQNFDEFIVVLMGKVLQREVRRSNFDKLLAIG